MISLSVVIITLNEERNILRCLQSVKNVADEIIILDSYSTDATAKIAESSGAKIFFQTFLGYSAQKNAALEYASFDWVLSLDADEALTPQLEQSILALKKNIPLNAYRMSRLSNYCGKWIKHGGWYPDRKTRLFNKTKGVWKGDPHDYWELYDKKEQVGKLEGDFLHYGYYTLSDQVKKIEEFTEIIAHGAVAKGKDCSLLKIWLGPKWKFFNDYILKLGFLDGYHGYLVCKYAAWYTFTKYSKIRQYKRLKEKTLLPHKES